MEALTQAFASLSWLIEYFSVAITLAGFWIALAGHRVSGLLIGFGSALHALGYYLLTHRPLGSEPSAWRLLMESTMYPGLLAVAVGTCWLAYELGKRRRGT